MTTMSHDDSSAAEMPTVSVLIANYNGIGVIEDCIASILQQSCIFPIEIIVHDDASTDSSTSLIRQRFPQVRLMESAANVGFCISNNRMATIASGEYLLLLNNDAMLMPGALTALLQHAIDLRQPAILTLPQYAAETGEFIDAGSFLDPFLNAVPNREIAHKDVALVIGACLWIPRKLWEELGGFPEWFGSIGEDLYLCCLARLRGFPVRTTGDSGFRHYVGRSLGGGKIIAGGLSTTRRRRACSERNKSFVMALTFPGLLFYPAFLAQQLSLLLEGVLLSAIKRDFSLWRVIYAPIVPALWTHRHHLLRLRREIQRQRHINMRQWLSSFTLVPYKLSMLLKHGLPEVK